MPARARVKQGGQCLGYPRAEPFVEFEAHHGATGLPEIDAGRVTCRGDLDVDCHHTIEDIGIALGTAIKEALGDKAGLVRYGSCMLPMDETLALCAVDLGGRPYFVYDASFAGQSCGGMDTQMAREFFYAVSYSAMMNLHLKVLYGENDHHKLEAMFKAFAKALDAATRRDARIDGVLSTKGTL